MTKIKQFNKNKNKKIGTVPNDKDGINKNKKLQTKVKLSKIEGIQQKNKFKKSEKEKVELKIKNENHNLFELNDQNVNKQKIKKINKKSNEENNLLLKKNVISNELKNKQNTKSFNGNKNDIEVQKELSIKEVKHSLDTKQEKMSKGEKKSVVLKTKKIKGMKTKVKPDGVQKFNKKFEKVSSKKSIKLKKEDKSDESSNKNEQKLEKNIKSKTLRKYSLQNVPSFNEEAFNLIVKEDNITNVVKVLKTQVSEEVSKKKNQIFSDYKYILDVICFKIPLCPKRLVKLKLKHALSDENADVCLIVKDLQRGSKFDFEPTIHFYEDLLNEKGIKGIKTIIPFNQLKKEYGSYEMKIKLSNLYDYFLCDGAIVGHVFGFLGKNFHKARCTLHAVRMNTSDLAREIKKALHKTSYKQGEKGTMISIPVATHNMPINQVADNVLTIVNQLKNVYPGGLPNIRSLYIKLNIKGTSALPLYISMAAPPKNTPNIIGPKEQKLKELKAKVNNTLTQFNMTSLGNLVRKSKNSASEKRKHEKQIDNQELPKKKKKKISENLNDKNIIEDKSKKSKKKTMDEKEKNKKIKISNSKTDKYSSEGNIDEENLDNSEDSEMDNKLNEWNETDSESNDTNANIEHESDKTDTESSDDD